MINIVKTPEWYLVNDRFMITDQSSDYQWFVFKLMLWEAMHYDTYSPKLIDYPWEYEVDGCVVVALCDPLNRLNFAVSDGEVKRWLIQSHQFVNNSCFEGSEKILVLEDRVITELTKQEDEYEYIDLRTIDTIE